MAPPKGSPKQGGRKKGTPNKNTVIKDAARKYSPEALKQLANLMKNADSDAAKVSACKEILDRAWGKSAQAHTGEGGEGPVELSLLMEAIDGATRGLPPSS